MRLAASIASAVARLALFKSQVVFDGALYASGQFLSTFWRVQSSLVRQNIPGEFSAFLIVLKDHSMLRWTWAQAMNGFRWDGKR
jgi:hypothetical protein